jgi:hypothetical protein
MPTIEKIWDGWKMFILGAGLLSLGMLWAVFPVMIIIGVTENNTTMTVIGTLLSYLQFKALYEINNEDKDR